MEVNGISRLTIGKLTTNKKKKIITEKELKRVLRCDIDVRI